MSEYLRASYDDAIRENVRLQAAVRTLEQERDTLAASLEQAMEASARYYTDLETARVLVEHRTRERDTAIAARDREKAIADKYERDWIDAKAEFGDAMARAHRERDEARAECARLRDRLTFYDRDRAGEVRLSASELQIISAGIHHDKECVEKSDANCTCGARKAAETIDAMRLLGRRDD